MKNKYVAAALAFFLGSFGVHKFYLRESGAGIFYIMLFVMTSRYFPVSAFLGMIDGMRYLTMGEQEFNQKYNVRRGSEQMQRRQPKWKKNRDYYDYAPPKTEKSKIPRSERSVRSNPFKKSGIKKYKEYDIEEAIIDFEKGLKLQPKDVTLHFNLACAYSLLENAEKAFFHISKCVEFGFNDYNKILNHDDLAYMRIQPEFDDFKKNEFKIVEKKEEEKEQAITDELLLEKLQKLVEMRNRGIVTEADFKVEKEKILRNA
jgi:TM2 domain-containing membrane protein YozV